VVEIFHKGKRVASHERSHKSGMTTNKEHMPSSHRAHAEWTPSRIINWAKTVGGATGTVVERVIASKPHPEQGYRSALGIIGLAKKHGADRLEKASHKVLQLGSGAPQPSYQSLKTMLKNRMEEVSVEIAPTQGSVPNNDEMLMRQTDLLASENIRGKDYYH
jgi:hypothetical protein